jgi:plasmid stabilization system protein ParE
MRYAEIICETPVGDDDDDDDAPKPLAQVAISTEAQADLEEIERWLSQPGSGNRAANASRQLIEAIDKLAYTAGIHQVDRYNSKNLQLAVGRYLVSYKYIVSAAGTRYAYVERVFGPGQDRNKA